MKILITSDLFDSTINGVVTSVKNLRRELEKNGHEVRILTVSDKCVSYHKDRIYYVMSVPAAIYPDVRIPVSKGRDYVKELIAWKPDVVHSQCEFFSYGFAKKIAKETGAVLIHTYHTLYEQYTKYVPVGKTLSRAALGKWMKLRLREADLIIAPTGKVERTLLEYGMENEIEVIPSGIRIDQFTKSSNAGNLEKLKEKYAIPEHKTVLLSIGRLGFEKRVDELLEGVKALTEHRSDILFLIVGDGPARGSLEKKARELCLDEVVRFTGMVQPQEIADYYKLGDIFVCASTSETQGLTYIEAMASALPLVCRKDPCLYGVLEEGGNGYSYETTEEFVRGVKQLMEHPQMSASAGIRSRMLAEQFGTELFGLHVEQSYRNVLSERRLRENESVTVCEESTDCPKKWRWAGYAHAGRIS